MGLFSRRRARGSIVPFEEAPEHARRLARAAISARVGSEGNPDAWIREFEDGLSAGRVEGGVWTVREDPTGLVKWQRRGAFGAVVDLAFVESRVATPLNYGRLLDAIDAAAGRVAFLPGPLVGLTDVEEESLLRGRGFARYGRSEMRWETGREPAIPTPPAGTAIRPVEPRDEASLARLHGAAYRGRFDFYLFAEDRDSEADARRHLGELLHDRYGPLAPEGSWAAEERGNLVAAVLSVRRPEGVLIAEVMTEPSHQGHGIGRAVLSTAVRALCATGVNPIYLNVTEGNERAVRLYTRLGFVRSLGPSRDWYNEQSIPAAPDGAR